MSRVSLGVVHLSRSQLSTSSGTAFNEHSFRTPWCDDLVLPVMAILSLHSLILSLHPILLNKTARTRPPMKFSVMH
jgi:hypothetical protein